MSSDFVHFLQGLNEDTYVSRTLNILSFCLYCRLVASIMSTSFTKTIYNIFFRRTAMIAFSTVVGLFAYERLINSTADYLFERRNQGKLWKHVQPSFKLKTGDEDETPDAS